MLRDRSLLTATFAGLVAVCAVPLRAQQRAGAGEEPGDTARLERVVVTATRTELSRPAAPVAVTVITGDALRAQGVVRVADALRQVPGAPDRARTFSRRRRQSARAGRARPA